MCTSTDFKEQGRQLLVHSPEASPSQGETRPNGWLPSGAEINQNAIESGRTMEPASLALQREVAPPSPTGHRVLADLSPWRQEQLETFFMRSIYEGRVFSVSPFRAHTFESQIPEDMVYSPQHDENYLTSKDIWIRW